MTSRVGAQILGNRGVLRLRASCSSLPGKEVITVRVVTNSSCKGGDCSHQSTRRSGTVIPGKRVGERFL